MSQHVLYCSHKIYIYFFLIQGAFWGVVPKKQKWKTQFTINGKLETFGTFDSEIDAALRHDEICAKRKLVNTRELNFEYNDLVYRRKFLSEANEEKERWEHPQRITAELLRYLKIFFPFTVSRFHPGKTDTEFLSEVEREIKFSIK